MSLLLPHQLPFGVLTVDEVWLEFDGPRLFSARNRLGQAFIFNAVDETDATMEYLAVPVSEQRLRMVRSGGFGLRAAFTMPEEQFVFEVTCDYEDDDVRVLAVSPESLTERKLPTPDAALSIPTETRPEFEPEELPGRARAEGRTLVAIRLNPPTLVRSEYPARSLSQMFKSFQSLTDALVQEGAGGTTARGGLPRQVVEDAELALVDLQAASFVAILAPSRSSRSTPALASLGLEMPAVLNALVKMHSLLAAAAASGNAPNGLREAVEEMGVRTLSKLRELLEAGIDQQTTLSVYLAPPDQDLLHVSVSTAAASSALLVLSSVGELEEEIQLDSAILVGVNLRTSRFELHDPAQEPHKFAGRIAEAARAQIEGLPTGEGHRYTATLHAATTVSDLSDELKISYSLTAIQSANPDSADSAR